MAGQQREERGKPILPDHELIIVEF